MGLSSKCVERAETTIQSVVLVPIVFLVAFMCFHLGSLFHQMHIAELAAIRGASIASGLDISAQSSSQARLEIKQVVSELGSRVVSEPMISYKNKGVEVTVRLRAISAISFLPSIATAQVWRPMESFRAETQR